MKLKAPEPKLPPSPLRLSVPGKLMAMLEDYARYFEAEHGQAIPVEEMVVQILDAFVAKDFTFARWRKAQGARASRASSTPSRQPAAPS